MDKLLTARQVSELLEVKISTVYDLVHRGIIPYVKLNRLLRFKKADVFRWVDSHTVRPKNRPSRKQAPPSFNPQKEFPL